MKYLLIAGAAILFTTAGTAQIKQGTINYERTSQMQMQFHAVGMEGMQQNIPQTRTDKFELVFANNQSIWRSAVTGDDDQGTFTSDNGGGMQMRMVIAGSNDVVYHNFDKAQRVEKREIMDRSFLVADSVRPLKWKMTGETKMILNHNCMKATATRISTSMRMNMDNGVMERKEVQDTSNIIAWVAADIPVSAGPGEFQGQLPGVILEMEFGNGRQVYKAISISEKADASLIKEPAGKKKLTPAEFAKERTKMMDEMQQNMQGGGGGRRIIIN
jgi:GLPGLI family protein